MGACLTHHGRKTTNTILPIDIIIEVLTRLPLPSLVRFKCLSKFFHTLILSPEFLHHRRSNFDDTIIVILDKLYRCQLFIFDDMHSYPEALFRRKPFFTFDKKIFKVLSCRGLLCILVALYSWSKPKATIIVFNPLTRFRREIRVSISSSDQVAFGYDSKTDDYKILAVVYKSSTGRRRIMVYSLKCNSWKWVEETNQEVRTSDALIVNHLSHCICSSQNTYDEYANHRICCFNFETERWEQNLPLPKHYQTNPLKINECVGLGVLHGCMCLFVNLYNDVKSYVTNIWIMKEYGVQDSWEKIFSTRHMGKYDILKRKTPFILPHVYKRGKAFIRYSWKDMVSYDITTDTRNVVDINDVKYRAVVHGCICTQSVVDIPGGTRYNKKLSLNNRTISN